MRKTVRKAKVHIISKLVREIRKLREKKCADGSEKFKTKADRLYEELTVVKVYNLFIDILIFFYMYIILLYLIKFIGSPNTSKKAVVLKIVAKIL